MTDASFYFYDLETSGFDPKEARIMQFAGRRTSMELQDIGQPDNYYIKITDDVLPNPEAILISGITPQRTIDEGLTEVEFLRVFYKKIAVPNTIFVGFNTIRFDDEFMCYMMYRNFYDPYEWQWQESRSRWDLLDVVRMTRALRPDGINWPSDDAGISTNRLELLASLNNLEHTNAHDALSDVEATIALARLVSSKQPKLFSYLLSMREKKKVATFVVGGQPFVYTSGRLASEFEKTTVACVLTDEPDKQGVLVFDLRYDPSLFKDFNPSELVEALRRKRDDPGPRLPVKRLRFNRCPAIAPLSVLDEASQQRLKLSPKDFMKNYAKFQEIKPILAKSVLQAMKTIENEREAKFVKSNMYVDSKLYEGFFSDRDKVDMKSVRQADDELLKSMKPDFQDERLQKLFPLYKARNFPDTLDDGERLEWDQFRQQKLLAGNESSYAAQYFAQLATLSNDSSLNDEQKFLLEELQLYGQSILPFSDN